MPVMLSLCCCGWLSLLDAFPSILHVFGVSSVTMPDDDGSWGDGWGVNGDNIFALDTFRRIECDGATKAVA